MYKKQAVLFGMLVALGLPSAAQAAEEVNIYSARKEDLIKPLLEKFSQESGVTVNLVTGDADALLKRLESEGANSPADLLLTSDAGRLHRAKAGGVLQAVESKTLQSDIPAIYRDPEGFWYGLSVRARPVMYAKGRVKPEQFSTYEALAEPAWKGKLCVRSSSNIYNQSMVASMIAANGEAKTEAWIKGLVDNFARPPAGGDRDQLKAVAAGQCDVALANTYYLGQMLKSSDPAEAEAAKQIGVFWPNQQDRGVHVNISGAGVTKSAKNKENAVKLLEYMVNDAAQQWYAQENLEYPLKPGIAVAEILKAWGEFKSDTLNLAKLGELNAQAVMLMDKAGWK